jgi:hypothetical protein
MRGPLFPDSSQAGANTKVKFLKRQMYGRAAFALLRQRIRLGQRFLREASVGRGWSSVERPKLSSVIASASGRPLAGGEGVDRGELVGGEVSARNVLGFGVDQRRTDR